MQLIAFGGAISPPRTGPKVVLILAWIYYSAQMFFDAEFTQVYANRYGSQIRPMEYAERIEEPKSKKAA